MKRLLVAIGLAAALIGSPAVPTFASSSYNKCNSSAYNASGTAYSNADGNSAIWCFY